MQQSCDEIHKIPGPSPSHNSSASFNSNKQRPNFITTVNPKHKDKLVAKLDQQTKMRNNHRKSPMSQKRQLPKSEFPKYIEQRPSSAMSNLTVRDQSIQTDDDTKEETFLKDTIIRYPSSTALNSNHPPASASTRGSLMGSLKKEGSTHSLGKSVSIKTPSESDSRNEDLIDDDDISENFDRKNFSDPKSDAKGRIIKSPVLDARRSKTEKPKRETLFVPPSKMKSFDNVNKSNQIIIKLFYRL